MIPNNMSGTSRWVSRLPPFARRALQVDQMEFDSALSQMYSLCVKPSLVSKMSKARSMTKHQYHRDDPAFLVLQVLFISISVVAYGCALQSAVFNILYQMVFDVLINYLIAGVVFASLEWVIVNRYMMGRLQSGEVRREIDWQYSFDIHCNGFFTYFMWTKVLQFVLLPVILAEGSGFSRLIANFLCLAGCSTYVYNVFLGYLELPMLVHQQQLLYPVPLMVIVFVLLLFSSFNYAAWYLSGTSLYWHGHPVRNVTI